MFQLSNNNNNNNNICGNYTNIYFEQRIHLVLGAMHLLRKGPEGGGVGIISTYFGKGGGRSNPFLRNIFQIDILY